MPPTISPPPTTPPPPARTAAAAPAAPSSASREGRLVRESAERERALALVRRKQRERERAESATATPSTVHGGGYADVFNRVEVEDAHRERDRAWRQRRWEDDAGNSRRPRPKRH
jgi:pyruvate/2-oxoglutarate dehydrogenase complex dihydrolipoamide acyltransferase (E2) component